MIKREKIDSWKAPNVYISDLLAYTYGGLENFEVALTFNFGLPNKNHSRPFMWSFTTYQINILWTLPLKCHCYTCMSSSPSMMIARKTGRIAMKSIRFIILKYWFIYLFGTPTKNLYWKDLCFHSCTVPDIGPVAYVLY